MHAGPGVSAGPTGRRSLMKDDVNGTGAEVDPRRLAWSWHGRRSTDEW